MQKAFLFDIDRCTGCQACQVACGIENQVAPELSWRQITTFNPQHYPDAPTFHLSLACNHCVDAPCMKSCPASAYTKNAQTGAVTIDAASCIGCKYCAWACPYDAPQFNQRAGVMEKCTFCEHRLAEGKLPSCVTACPTGALQFGDYDGMAGESDTPGFPRVDVEPAIRFLQPRYNAPEASSVSANGNRRAQPVPSKVTLRSEWSLVVFTLLAAVLVAWMMAAAAGAAVQPIAFGALGAVALAVSAMHLGKPARAWRAILNWRTSWVSREVIGFSGFLGLSALYLLTGGESAALIAASVVAGALALFAIDQVYSVTATPGLQLHSARTMLVAPFLAAVFLNEPRIFVALGAMRLLMYLARKVRRASSMSPQQWMWSGLRVMVGMALPAAWAANPSDSGWLPLVCVLIGETIDRAQFYNELEISTPRRQADLDLQRALRGAA